MDKEIAIKVSGVSKTFKIPHEKITSLKGAFVGAFRKKSYEEFKALDDVSFEVKKGEFFGIIGRNGSGKSTLLKVLAGIYKADKGNVHINGLISPFLELGIGFNPELSGRDNVYLNATVLGLTKKEIDAKFNLIVKFSELERFIDQKLKNYSSGMQVRLAFSVSIHANREILLMDEVLAVGDSNFQRKCITEFEKYKKLGKTVILVTHDIQTVTEYCDRVMLLNKGLIVKVGNPQKIALEYQEINMSDEDRRIREEMSRKEKVKREEEGPQKNNINKKVRIYSCKIFNNNGEETFALESGKEFQVKLQAEFMEDVENVSFGVMFRNGMGKDLLGLHSLYSKNPLKIKEIKKEKKVEVIFSGEMILAEGVYALCVNIASDVRYPKYNLIYSEENNINIQVFSNDIIWGATNSNHITKLIELEK